MTEIEMFDAFFAKVKTSAIWQTMTETVEDSPWHREANVAVHTEMTIDAYKQLLATPGVKRTGEQTLMTLLSLLFHDFGKPDAEEEVARDDGTVYRRYAGHERTSANEMVSFLLSSGLMADVRAMGLTDAHVRQIKFIVENHLPYGLKNKQKRENLAMTVRDTLGDNIICFFDQLWCDTKGRISDDQDEKIRAVEEWIANFEPLIPDVPMVRIREEGQKRLTILHGPVGVGKSTWIRQNAKGAAVFSEDNLRHHFFITNALMSHIHDVEQLSEKEAYAVKWQFCADNRDAFDKMLRDVFAHMIRNYGHVVVDGTNQTRKRRGGYIQPARQAGFYVEAVEFYCSMEVSAMRQNTRPDKCVPYSSVRKIYMNLETPWLGSEVDAVTFYFQE